MSRPIGYYVHHHGDGHRQRALVIAQKYPDRFTLIGTGFSGKTEGLRYLELEDDRPVGDILFGGLDNSSERPKSLHYAPFDNQNIRRRVSRITNWIAQEQPALMVVDVSAEIAMLARLTSTPTVYVRLCGTRNDPAHEDAFRGAQAVFAPFHEEMDGTDIADWVRKKTKYFPGLIAESDNVSESENVILVVYGAGGTAIDSCLIAEAAGAMPEFEWRVIGPAETPLHTPNNLKFMGWVDNASEMIAKASIVIGGAGDGLVTAVIAFGRRFICLPQNRPYGEQIMKARRLEALGGAVVIDNWPSVAAWPEIIARARALQLGILQRLHDSAGPEKAAKFLVATADALVT